MTIREQIEQMEKENLSPYACLQRRIPEAETVTSRNVTSARCFKETEIDTLHRKSFRRLKSKTHGLSDTNGGSLPDTYVPHA